VIVAQREIAEFHGVLPAVGAALPAAYDGILDAIATVVNAINEFA
jgi:hypothetical protein